MHHNINRGTLLLLLLAYYIELSRNMTTMSAL